MDKCEHTADFAGAPRDYGERPRGAVTCVLDQHDARSVPHTNGEWQWRQVSRSGRTFTVTRVR